MTDARRTRSTLDPNRLMKTVEAGLERNRQSMEDGQAAIADRLTAAFERIDDRFNSLEHDVRHGSLKRDELASEVQELRRQVLDTRDAIQRDGGNQTQAAARGAAEGATQAIMPAMTAAARVEPKALIKAAMETTTGRLLALAAAIATMGSGIENIPKIVQWVGAVAVGVWTFLSKAPK